MKSHFIEISMDINASNQHAIGPRAKGHGIQYRNSNFESTAVVQRASNIRDGS